MLTPPRYNKVQEFLEIKIAIIMSPLGKEENSVNITLFIFQPSFFFFYSVKTFKLYIYYFGTKNRMPVLTHRAEIRLNHHIEKTLH